MARDADRIDGWKAIARHFERDRSTVIRWARDRAMPVHSIPGGKTRTVYAYLSELDAWARRSGAIDEPDMPELVEPDGEPVPEPDPAPFAPPPPVPRPRRLPLLLLLGLIAAVVAIGIGIGVRGWRPRAEAALPADPRSAALFLQARDDWAQRSPASIAKAITELEEVTRRDPRFAPGFAVLADAYLLGQEAGSLPADAAFAHAEQAAKRARQLDPDLAAADRALGFIAYWRDGDRRATGTMFAQALRLRDDDPQTHFWLANILADNGEDGPAMQEFGRARLLDPGSPHIAADLAWANWSAGRSAEAETALARIEAAHPDDVETLSCRGIVRLAAGDYPGYLAELHARAALRHEPGFDGYVAALDRAITAGGVPAMQAEMLARQMRLQGDTDAPDHSLAAFFASLAGNRAGVLEALRLADAHREQWGSAGYVIRIAARWRGDGEVQALLARRRAPQIAPAIA